MKQKQYLEGLVYRYSRVDDGKNDNAEWEMKDLMIRVDN